MKSTVTSPSDPSARRSSTATITNSIAAMPIRAIERLYVMGPCGHHHEVIRGHKVRTQAGALTYVGQIRCRKAVLHVYEKA